MCLCVCLKLYYGGVPYYYYSIRDNRRLKLRDLRRTDTILTNYDRRAVAMHGEALVSDMARHLFRTWEALASDMGRHLFRHGEALALDMGRHLFRT